MELNIISKKKKMPTKVIIFATLISTDRSGATNARITRMKR